MNSIRGTTLKTIGLLPCTVVALLAFAAINADKAALRITDLFTKEETKKSGLSKLTHEGLEALNPAALRVFVEISARATAASPPSRLGARDDDIDLYDSTGNAVAYIAAVQDVTVYLWSGKPCAYLDDDNIYGLNGKHLGWFKSGLVYDHDGYVVAAVAEVFRAKVETPPPKSLKQLRPLKGLKELKPLKPLFSKQWSETPTKVFFLKGLD